MKIKQMLSFNKIINREIYKIINLLYIKITKIHKNKTNRFNSFIKTAKFTNKIQLEIKMQKIKLLKEIIQQDPLKLLHKFLKLIIITISK